MTVTVSLTRSDVFTQLRAFILGVIDCEVVNGLDNGVPMPVGGFITITPVFQNRLSTNVDTYADSAPASGTKTSQASTQYTVQIDCYGPNSSDWAAILSTLMRDEYACNAMTGVQPLSADDPKMMPLVNGEQNYEERWCITALLQCNPAVITPMQFFDEAHAGVLGVNEEYPS